MRSWDSVPPDGMDTPEAECDGEGRTGAERWPGVDAMASAVAVNVMCPRHGSQPGFTRQAPQRPPISYPLVPLCRGQ